jgi:hypothetical protein
MGRRQPGPIAGWAGIAAPARYDLLDGGPASFLRAFRIEHAAACAIPARWAARRGAATPE